MHSQALLIVLMFLNLFSMSAKAIPALQQPGWHFFSPQFKSSSFVYTPFFIDNSEIKLFTGGGGTQSGNGVLSLTTSLTDSSKFEVKNIIPLGPKKNNYNYFRAVRVARNGNLYWLLAEVSGCYNGCDSRLNPKSLAAYTSSDGGKSWTFIDYIRVNGKRYVAQWFGHTGLIYNPSGSSQLNLTEPENNRFITVGEDRDILVSNDGVNYASIPMNHPFPKDRLVFASIARTPFGFHMMTCANWSDTYYTTTVRHLFSKDLINWVSIEDNSFLKNPNFYKGVHLSYDEESKKLWALSPCGKGNCDFLAWLEPRDFLAKIDHPDYSDQVPIGEHVYLSGQTAMIISSDVEKNKMTYQVRHSAGAFSSGYTKEMMTFPLANYTRNGCHRDGTSYLCVGDTVSVGKYYASIMGFYAGDPKNTKYALKFQNGVVDTGYNLPMLILH
jgi:hypothetical protein